MEQGSCLVSGRMHHRDLLPVDSSLIFSVPGPSAYLPSHSFCFPFGDLQHGARFCFPPLRSKKRNLTSGRWRLVATVSANEEASQALIEPSAASTPALLLRPPEQLCAARQKEVGPGLKIICSTHHLPPRLSQNLPARPVGVGYEFAFTWGSGCFGVDPQLQEHSDIRLKLCSTRPDASPQKRQDPKSDPSDS